MTLRIKGATTIKGSTLVGRYNPNTASCIGWWDAADAATVTLVSGAVSQWNDKSGLGYNVGQTTAGIRPTYSSTRNGRNVITFNSGTTQWLGREGAAFMNNIPAWSIFVVGNSTITSASTIPFCVNSSNFAGGLTMAQVSYTASNYISALGRRLTTDSSFAVTGSSAAGTGLRILSAVGTFGGSLTAYLDGILAATNSPFQAAGNSNVGGGTILFGVGAGVNSGYWNGDICEILVYKTELSNIEQNAITSYLKAKWNIA